MVLISCGKLLDGVVLSVLNFRSVAKHGHSRCLQHASGVTRKASLAQLALDCEEERVHTVFTASVPRTLSIDGWNSIRKCQELLAQSSHSWILKRSEANRGRDIHVLRSSDAHLLPELCYRQGPWVRPPPPPPPRLQYKDSF